jgi:DNA-binding transcriptional regulator YbjK
MYVSTQTIGADMTHETRRRRDPVRRRQEIIDAAAELVTEVGVAALTHRLVAARAGVALGSTTHYFATLDELRAAALARLGEDVQAYVTQVALTVSAAGTPGDLAAALAQGLHDYLSDPKLVRADVALTVAATLDPQLRPLTDRWFAGLSSALTSHMDDAAAQRVILYIGGATWHSALHEAPPDLASLTTAFRLLFSLDEGVSR